MIYSVSLTDDAVQDLEALYDYIEAHDVPGKAEHVLDKLELARRASPRRPWERAEPLTPNP
jgi:toxin ParE1/3/4